RHAAAELPGGDELAVVAEAELARHREQIAGAHVGHVIGNRLRRLLERNAERLELAFDDAGHGVLQRICCDGRRLSWPIAPVCASRSGRGSLLRPSDKVPMFAAIRDRITKGRESTRGWADTLKPQALKPAVQKGFIAVDCSLAPRSAVLAALFFLLAPILAAAQDSHAQDNRARDAQEGPIVLVPHRAVYDLSLDQTRGNSQVAAVRGRIFYDFD